MISVIVPIFNEQCTIEDRLQVLTQWFQTDAVELIFVDGGSTDQGPSILANAGLTCIRSNPGRAEQMNAGAEVSSGDILLFVHIDTDICDFKEQLLFLNQTFLGAQLPSCFWGFHSVKLWSPIASPLQRVGLLMVGTLINLRSRLTQVSTGDQCQFFSQAFFQRIGGFPRQRLLEDVQISKNARRYSKPFVCSQMVHTSARRWIAKGFWRTVVKMWSIRFRYWRGVSPEILAREYREVR